MAAPYGGEQGLIVLTPLHLLLWFLRSCIGLFVLRFYHDILFVHYLYYILPKIDITTLCSKNTCDHVFDDKLKQNCPFTKIFGTLITKSIGHRQVFLVSHLTYLVQLLYLGKLSRHKRHEFSLKLLIFQMLQY